jgi:nitrite reductase (NADH) large subunit
MSASKQKLVVIGNGMAGARTVEEILARGGGEQFDITIFGDEPHGNYNRILLSAVLNGTREADEIFLHPRAWYEKHNLKLHAGARVTKIDRAAKNVAAGNGLCAAYDKLIIATGSRPFVPPLEGMENMEGDAKPGIFVFRTLEDCRRIAGYANKCEKAAVIGGGLLGLEAARGLLNFGCEVHVVQSSDRLMNQQLDGQAAQILQATIRKMGIRVHTGKRTTEICGDDRVTGLRFCDGETLNCDMVIIACGVRPNVELAQACGLTVERAIVVDDQLRSINDENIYVVGECAQHRGLTYGLVAPLWEMGEVLADHITHKNPSAAYTGSKISTKLKVLGVELAAWGVPDALEENDETVHYAEPKRGVYKKLVIRDDRLIGGILLGDLSKVGELIPAFDRASILPEDRASLLFETQTPDRRYSMIEMPDDAPVCQCNGVNKGVIRRCVLAGAKSMSAVMSQTRAGTGCGSCKSLVREIAEWANEGFFEE